MKKIFLIVALIATAFVQKTFAQDISNQKQLSQLLTSYYQVKDALIEGNSTNASSKAEVFLKAANGISNRAISEGSRNALVKDAGVISDSKDIKKQREVFTNLSTNMYALAKSLRLTAEPIYYNYCPMKKAYWLSNNKVIKNPYYGSAMLTCGKVTETIK
jgi:hypothetical protein